MARKTKTPYELLTSKITPSALARVLGCTVQAVCVWKDRGIPADRLEQLYRITKIPTAQLRPDLAKILALGQPRT